MNRYWICYALVACLGLSGCGGRPMVQQWPVEHPANAEAAQVSMPRASSTLAVEADEGLVIPAQSPVLDEKAPHKPEDTPKPKQEHPEHEGGENPKPAPEHPHHHGGSK